MVDEKLKKVFEDINDDKKNNERAEEWEKKKEEEVLGERYCCRKCGSVIKFPLGLEIKKCSCGSSDLEFLLKELYTKSQYDGAVEQFRNKELLTLIWDELSKTHIGDDCIKLTTFLTSVSSLLKNQKRRMSLANTGDSAEGKDNNIKTSLKHIPRGVGIFLTSGTQATIEDDIKDKRIIAFSEVNANREAGANKFFYHFFSSIFGLDFVFDSSLLYIIFFSGIRRRKATRPHKTATQPPLTKF